MSPHPLPKVARNVKTIRIGASALADRPNLSALVMQVIGLCSQIEYELQSLVAGLLKADFHAVAEMLSGLRNSENVVGLATAAAHAVLAPEDFSLFQATIRVVQPIRRRRNEYAHNAWASCDELPDALLLIEPKFLIRLSADYQRMSRDATQMRMPGQLYVMPKDFSDVLVYREPDVRNDIAAAREASTRLFELAIALSEVPISATIRKRLLARPDVQQFLLSQSSESAP